MTSRFFQPLGHRDRSLGLGYHPEHGMPAPTASEAQAWCEGAKTALLFAAETMRAAQAAGRSVEEAVAAVEAAHVVPHDAVRYGHAYETAVIMDAGDLVDVAWFAWQVPSRGENDTPEYLRAVGLCRVGHPTDAEIEAALDGRRPYGSQGNVYRIAAQRRRTKIISPVTVKFEGGYPRYTSTPKEGQSLRDFVFACAMGLGSERLTSLMGNDQDRFEIDGVRLSESDPASSYGGRTVTVVMVYDPTEEV